MNEQEREIFIKSVNDAKSSIRKVQEKLFDEDINTKEIFNITVKINDFLDEIASQLYKNKNNE